MNENKQTPQEKSAQEHDVADHKDHAAEMEVDLGYADSSDDQYHHSEQDSDEHFESIQTLSLDQMVVDDGEHDEDMAVHTEPAADASRAETPPASSQMHEGTVDPEAIPLLSEPHDEPEVTLEPPKAHQADTGITPDATAFSAPSTHSEPLAPTDNNLSARPSLNPKEGQDATLTFAPVSNPAGVTPAAGTPITKPQPDKGANPFLPQHILDKLHKGRQDMAEDIALSGSALDISTALLRTQARADRFNRPQQHSTNPFASKDSHEKQKQKLVDDLVDEYVPLIAAELRRRLHKLLDQ